MYNYVKVFTRFRHVLLSTKCHLNDNNHNNDKKKNTNTTKNDISRNRDKNKKACLVLRFHINDK